MYINFYIKVKPNSCFLLNVLLNIWTKIHFRILKVFEMVSSFLVLLYLNHISHLLWEEVFAAVAYACLIQRRIFQNSVSQPLCHGHVPSDMSRYAAKSWGVWLQPVLPPRPALCRYPSPPLCVQPLATPLPALRMDACHTAPPASSHLLPPPLLHIWLLAASRPPPLPPCWCAMEWKRLCKCATGQKKLGNAVPEEWKSLDILILDFSCAFLARWLYLLLNDSDSEWAFSSSSNKKKILKYNQNSTSVMWVNDLITF